MKSNGKLSSLVVSEDKTTIQPFIYQRFDFYPENNHRPVNKVIYSNKYFRLTYNVNKDKLSIASKGDIIYSTIPYDLARNYIQRASVQFLLHPERAQEYIESHKMNLYKYIQLGIFQTTGKRVDDKSVEVQEAYEQIFQDPFFEIQILGRLLQHDETGPLSANLAKKFLYSENLETGISAYISEYLKFVMRLVHELPVWTDGRNVQLVDSGYEERLRDMIFHDTEQLRRLVWERRMKKFREEYPNSKAWIEDMRNGKVNKEILELDEILQENDEEIQKDDRVLAIGLDHIKRKTDNDLILNAESNVYTGIKLLSGGLEKSLELSSLKGKSIISTRPVLRSERGRELSEARKNYVGQSVSPKKIEMYFENVLSTDNTNQINVVSDIHTTTGKLPFNNPNFNIFGGDVSDSQASDLKVKGIYVIGNHELSDVLSLESERNNNEWDRFRNTTYFNQLVTDQNNAWSHLPIGNSPFYAVIAKKVQERFPNMSILNNSSTVYKGIRYIGLTIPVVFVQRIREVQKFVFETLKELLEDDSIPTVIVSHAPLFNELSMLSLASKSYNKRYICYDDRIVDLFERFNIVGVIHGHHHIPASMGRFKKVRFAGRERFVVCSIYSHLNTGFELGALLPSISGRDRSKGVAGEGLLQPHSFEISSGFAKLGG